MPTNPSDTSTAAETTSKNLPTSSKPETDDQSKKKKQDEFRARIEVCKTYRRKLIPLWSVSIDYRRGKPFASQTDDDTVSVNMDWSLTKSKQAALFSQVPKVRINHPPESLEAGPSVPQFERRLNDTLVMAGVEGAMDECLPDCINAAGFGVVLVSYEAITENKEVPAIDLSTLPPEFAQEAEQSKTINGQPIPMTTVPQVVDHRYVIQRISPGDYLWPINFTSSNFDKAPWQGRSGKITWAEAIQKKWVTEEDKSKILEENDYQKSPMERLTSDVDKDTSTPDKVVGFDEIFYKEFQYDSKAKSYSTIHHLVFLDGKEAAVIDEPWKGQKVDEETHTILGSSKTPMRVLTLTYITDETIPPSDSSIGRHQVNELNKSRTQMIKQRERTIPVRWFDVNRVDPAIQQGLMRGTWQHMIPVQGEGSRIIGEVAKATMPQEDFTFDQITKNDLSEMWTIGPNQVGSGADVETKGESSEIASNFQTRVGRERAKVAAFFVGIAEVLGGLMCLYEDPTSFGEEFDKTLSSKLQFSILADSTVLVDSSQRLERLNTFVNTYAKTGYVQLEPVLKEIATLNGLDPTSVIKAPDPAPPPEPNTSIRLTGAEDMMNPLVLAYILGQGQPPTPELIEQAKQLIQSAVIEQPPQPQGQPQVGPDGQPIQGEQPPEGQPPPPGPPPTPIGEANPDAAVLPKITKRSDDPNLGGKEE